MTDFDEIEAIGPEMIHRVCKQMVEFCTPYGGCRMRKRDRKAIEFVRSFEEWANMVISGQTVEEWLTSR